jgi:hypothetical protein
VTFFVGLAYFLAGTFSHSPSAFWRHVVAGALISVPLVHWWHTGDTQWALISAASLAYVFIAYMTKRSSWAVFGTIGFFGATVHYLVGSPTSILGGVFAGETPPHVSPWSPALAFGLLGFWLVLLGLLGRHQRVAAEPAPE